ncbi:MAG TPA: matrixin family metalloprotease [Candidatus Thermoplasmatota archaeon]|nr:matrixin family metalloprotease [Candidatus Thermoplasmatota archaeon]
MSARAEAPTSAWPPDTRRPRRARLLAGLVALGLFGGGALWWTGAGDGATEVSRAFGGSGGGVAIVAFDDIEARYFHAITVDRERGETSTRPLIVRLAMSGPIPDTGEAERWLRDHANVLIVRSPDGAPVVFTDQDLATDRGNAAVGATVPRGVAIETRDASLLPCVFAHEILHLLGLHHVEDEGDIMAARCDEDKPGDAAFADKEKLDRLRSVRAFTLTGRVTWAERL